MPNITTYATKATPMGADKLPGTDSVDGSTKNFLLSAILPYDFPIGAEATIAGGEVLLRFICPRALRLPANLAGSVGSAAVAPTASTTLTIRKRLSGATAYTTVGSFVFATGTAPIVATSLTTTGGVAVDFAVGDELSVIGPATADATLAQWAVTLSAIYQ